jgi:hypothetical protein
MKKLALILALMLVPCTAFGLEMLNDNAMDQVTGQSGVAIAFDDVQMFLNIERLAWVDCDGFEMGTAGMPMGTCAGSGAMVSLNNFQIDVINVNAIVAVSGVTTNPWLISTSCGNIPLFYAYQSTARLDTCITWTTGHTEGLDNLTGPFRAQALTIDVTDKLPALTQGICWNASNANVKVAGVFIGLPTVEIHIQELNLDITIDDLNVETWVANAGNGGTLGDNSFGQIIMEDITFSILSGWMEIAPH